MDLRPIYHLQACGKLYSQAWKQVDIMRRDRGKDLPNWPDWCFLPMSGWYAIVSADVGMALLPPHLSADVARLSAIGAWRYSQGIYRFDQDTAKALTNTTLKGDIPVDVVLRLPEWSIYIETPGFDWLGEILHGFWAHLEWDENTKRRELRILLDCENLLMPQILHLGNWTVTEAVDRWFKEAKRQSAEHKFTMFPDDALLNIAIKNMVMEINPLLSMLLYLCSDEPDIGNREYPEEIPRHPQPKKTKKGWRLFPPPKPKIWNVGDSIGKQFRRELINSTNRTVRPHLRRAHWHGFWSGPKNGDRRFGYKWLPPIVVAGENDNS